MGVNYCKGSYGVNITTDYNVENKTFEVSMGSEIYDADIRYTTDGSVPLLNSDRYHEPFIINQSTTIEAAIFEDGEMKEKASENKIVFHKGIGKAVAYENKWNTKYPARGEQTLVDGIRGSERYSDGRWQGFKGDDLVVEIDLDEPMKVNHVTTGFFQRQRSWIFLPEKVTVSVSSDGDTWIDQIVGHTISTSTEGEIIKGFSADFDNIEAQFVRVVGHNLKGCPDWHPGSGEDCWIFADEIVLE